MNLMCNLKARLVTFAPGKPVEPVANNKQSVIIPLESDTRMFYMTLNLPCEAVVPAWLINRREYQKIMQGRGLKGERPAWIPMPGEQVLPWTEEVDLSKFVQSLLDAELYVVSAETDLVKIKRGGKEIEIRKVWIGFVTKKAYEEPKAVEFKDLKKNVLDFLEQTMFAGSQRWNVSIHFNPMKRSDGEVDENATSVAITFDRRHIRRDTTGGCHMFLRDGKLFLKNGPARR